MRQLTRHHDVPGIESLQLLLRESEDSTMTSSSALDGKPGPDDVVPERPRSPRDGPYPAAHWNLWEELLPAATVYQQITRQANAVSADNGLLFKKGKNSIVWLTLQDITLKWLPPTMM